MRGLKKTLNEPGSSKAEPIVSKNGSKSLVCEDKCSQASLTVTVGKRRFCGEDDPHRERQPSGRELKVRRQKYGHMGRVT